MQQQPERHIVMYGGLIELKSVLCAPRRECSLLRPQLKRAPGSQREGEKED